LQVATVVHVPVVASLPAGPKVYSDASYNPTVAGETAAIGVYLQHLLLQLPFYIQAISNSAKSALEAEGEAMFLAALAGRALS
jgi:hypothetical protein